MKYLALISTFALSLSSFAAVSVSCVDKESETSLQINGTTPAQVRQSLEAQTYRMRANSNFRVVIKDDETMTVIGNEASSLGSTYVNEFYLNGVDEEYGSFYESESLYLSYLGDNHPTAGWEAILFVGEADIDLVCFDIDAIVGKYAAALGY